MQRYDVARQHSRLLVLGDPHGALGAVRRVFERERDDRTLAACVGDVVGYADGPASSRLAEFLRDEAVPTVEGNHEDWVRGDSLAIVEDRAAPRQLAPEALNWMRTLPATIDFRRTESGEPLALMVHSIRNPGWDWISAANAQQFVESLNSPKLIVSGHSHRPKFIVIAPDDHTSIEPFDFQRDDEKTIKLPQDGWLIVDAGSLGRAELEPSIRGGRPGRGPVRFGTYGLIDFDQGRAILRRVEMR